MLYLVGLGLGDARDITVRGLEVVRAAHSVFLESYTSILTVDRGALVSVAGQLPRGGAKLATCLLLIQDVYRYRKL